MRASALTFTGLLIIGFVGLEKATQACSYSDSIGREVFPASGAMGLPTNTEVRVAYYNGYGLSGSSVVVRPVGGPPIALDIVQGSWPVEDHGFAVRSAFTVLAKPIVPLLPNTTYEILDRVIAGCGLRMGDAGECMQSDAAVVSTFVTGPARDDAAPVFAGGNGATTGSIGVCDSSACCGPYAALRVTLSWDPSSDDLSADFIRYNLYRAAEGDGGIGGIALRYVPGPQLSGALLCSGGPLIGYGIRGMGTILTPGRYAVRAVDAAGHEDQNAAVIEVRGTCAGPDNDGGFTDAARDQTTVDHQDPPADAASPSDAYPADSSDIRPSNAGDVATEPATDARADLPSSESDVTTEPATDTRADLPSSESDVTTGPAGAGPPSSTPLTASCDCVMARRPGSTWAPLGGLLGMLMAWVVRRSRR